MGLLQGKIAIVTGAASPAGLGKATALLFAEHGATVVITDLDENAAASAVSDLPGDGHIGMAGDVVDRDACAAVAEAVVGALGRVDVLVNNAGITQSLKLMEIESENYDAVTDVSLRGTLNMSQSIIPTMRSQKSGSIINLSSVSAQRGGGIFGGPHYSAAKAGVLGLTKAIARELAPDNVRSNAICPGFIATEITAGKLTDELRAHILAGIPMGRAGKAEDVAGCALFLASDLSAYCTGTEIDVNGGLLIH